MKTLLILGAGTGGTMMANKMAQKLDLSEWRIIVVDKDETHYYQPGFLFIPFGIYGPEEVRRPKRNYLPQGVEVIFSDIEVIESHASRVKLTKDSRVLHYDQLIIATGTRTVPEETPGLQDGGWYKNVFDFYTYKGAVALAQFLRRWPGGRLVLNVAEMPIKCPVAPLEFLFLAHAFFHERGLRDKVEIVYATPLPGAFTKPRTSAVMGTMLQERGIHLEAEFTISEVDNSRQVIASYDGREINYDLLVTIPVHMGSTAIQNSKLGDALHFVPTHKHTLQSKQWPNVWVIGDATDLPASKAGSVAHFEADVLTENLLRHLDGLEPEPAFDGHANCFIESGFGKGFLIDFNYDTEPLPGKFPMPGVGPFDLLKESEANHWGKLMFRWIYWNLLLRGAELPLETQMSMVGKHK
ncbi:MAG: NAD(P)/FAD-dependent oxidoreductase [Anaerolineales bacterium]|nr:NAD(P)/FAD-dependent oxidoreductase [Anaerolineales bacterium]